MKTFTLSTILVLALACATSPAFAAPSVDIGSIRGFENVVLAKRAGHINNGDRCDIKKPEQCKSGYCEKNLFRNKCAAKKGNGQSCDENEGCESEYCASQGFARTKKCEAKPAGNHSLPAGASCAFNDQCKSDRCEGEFFSAFVGKKCQRQKENGESCKEDIQCDSGICAAPNANSSKRCSPKGQKKGALCWDNRMCSSGKCPGPAVKIGNERCE